jgi:hypothetical protein
MLSWLFKKRGAAAAPGAAPAAATTPTTPPTRKARETATDTAGRQAAQALHQAAQAQARAAENWPGRLQQALGDDAALLQLATTAPGIDTRLAAVEALAGEDALRQAERAFRTRDRKVHRLAKARLDTAVARRESRAKAQQLIVLTDTLLQDPLLPVNHVVQLDRDWQALPAALLDAEKQEAFTALRSRLDSAIRERAEAEQQLQHWKTQARSAIAAWQSVLATASAPAPDAARTALSELRSQVQDLRARRPAGASTEALDAALAQLLADADSAQAAVDAPPQAQAEAAIQPAPDIAAAVRSPKPDRQATADQCQHLQALLQLAEQALAEGQLALLQQHLQAADALVANSKGTQWPAALRAQQQAVRSEQLRLKGWQSWGGQRARDDLIAQAQALARLTLPVPGPDSEGATETPPAPKLNLRAHADAIHGLRMRWKALDKLGEGAHGDLWQRFDQALTSAHQPVAEQHAAQQAARQQNLATRQALLDTLDAVPRPDTSDASTDTAHASWHDAARQLDAFQLAWRQLGPVQHTAPSEAREALLQRMQASIQRLEQPLRQARERAAAEREQLIQRAQALLAANSQPLHGGELQRQLRGLQAQWQEQARSLPLPRATESALWQRFRAACDAVFAQRDAAFAAREAEQAAEVSEREAVLARLAQLSEQDVQAPQGQIDRLLVEADRAWNRIATGLPRAVGSALQARYDSARAAASAASQRALRLRWQARIDAWAAPLATPPNGVPDVADVPDQHDRLDVQPGTARGDAEPGIDDALLQLEIALDLPASPEWQVARRQLKLRALKETMEGRRPTPGGPSEAAGSLLSLLREPGLNTAQRQRLLALLAALRDAAPGTLGLPLPPA